MLSSNGANGDGAESGDTVEEILPDEEKPDLSGRWRGGLKRGRTAL